MEGPVPASPTPQPSSPPLRQPLPLAEAQIRREASPNVFKRGQEYWRAGVVEELTRRGETLQAEVSGSAPLPYQVHIRVGLAGVESASCTCPFGAGGWCKHVVATLLTAIHDPAAISERPPLAEALAPLDQAQLRTLLLRLTERDPALVGRIERLLPGVLSGPAATAAAAATVALELDLKALRRQARGALHVLDDASRSEAYWHMGEIVAAEREVLAQAWELIRAGAGQSALQALEVITSEYAEGWQWLQDDEGELSIFFFELGAAWAEALLTEPLTPADGQHWGQLLDDWAKPLGDYDLGYAFDAALLAARHGWGEVDLSEREDDVEAFGFGWHAPPTGIDGYIAARLNVLERQGRFTELLDYARLTDEHARAAVALARLNRLDEAASLALERLTQAADAFTVAVALHASGAGSNDDALRVAEHGLTLNGPHAALASWLRELAVESGDTPRAVAAAAVAVREEPTLAAWRRAAELAADAWPATRDALLKDLRRARRDALQRAGAIDIFLVEGLFDDAIKAVKGSDRYEDQALLTLVADAVAGERPAWVSATGRAQAEAIAGAGAAAHYDDAATWLARARAADTLLGQTAEWRAYLEALIEQHRRKYKLRPLLEALRR